MIYNKMDIHKNVYPLLIKFRERLVSKPPWSGQDLLNKKISYLKKMFIKLNSSFSSRK